MLEDGEMRGAHVAEAGGRQPIHHLPQRRFTGDAQQRLDHPPILLPTLHARFPFRYVHP
jgi:hypothetical protein